METNKTNREFRLKSYKPEEVQQHIDNCDKGIKSWRVRKLKYKAHLWFVTDQISFEKLEYYFKKCDKILMKLGY